MCYIVNLKNLDRCYWKAYQILEKKSGDYFVLRLWCYDLNYLAWLKKSGFSLKINTCTLYMTSVLRLYTILEINVS